MTPQGIGIISFAFVGVAMLVTAAAALLSVVFLRELWRFGELRRRQANSRSTFLDKLLDELAGKRIQELGDVHESYRLFFGVGVLRSSHLEEVGGFLAQAKRRSESAGGRSPDRPLHGKGELLNGLLEANERALEVERLCIPFSGTPEPERGMLAELLRLSAENESRAAATLAGLARVIRFRQDTTERLGQESARSLRLARWGWYATLVLSMLSAILGLICLGV